MMDMEMNAELERDDESEIGEAVSEGSSAESFFVNLEQDYARIKTEMRENEELAKYEDEYVRLFQLLHRSRKSEKELIENGQILKDEIEETNKKMIQLENELTTQQANIKLLNEEIVRSKKLVDVANCREQKAQETAENLQVIIAKLENELIQLKKHTVDEKGLSNDKKIDKILSTEKDALLNELEVVKLNYKNAMTRNEKLQKTIDNLNQSKSEIQELLDTKINDVTKERRLRERTEGDVEKLKADIYYLMKEFKSANLSLNTFAMNISKLEVLLKEKITALEAMEQERNKLVQAMKDLETKYESMRFKNKQINESLTEKKEEGLRLIQDYNRTNEALLKLKSEYESATRKLLLNDEQIAVLKEDLRLAKLSEQQQKLECNLLSKNLNEEMKKVENLKREVETLTKTIVKNKNGLVVLQADLQTSALSANKLESNLDHLSKKNKNLMRDIAAKEQDKDKLTKLNQTLKNQIEDQQNKIKTQKFETENYKNLLSEMEIKYRLQQNEYLKNDSLADKRILRQTRDELDDVKIKLKMMSEQVEYYKDQVAISDKNLNKEEYQLGKLEKERDELKSKLQKSQQMVSTLSAEIEDLKREEKDLRSAKEIMDLEVSKLQKDINALMSERDILGTELVRRNSEIISLNKKIKDLTTTIQRGETERRQRSEDIRLLKLEVKKIRSEKALLIKRIQNNSDLRQEVMHLQRKLTKERVKVTALIEETENPINVHRWRKLGGTNVDVIESQKKISILNKRILKSTTRVINAEKKLKTVEEMNKSLQEMLNKQYKPELVQDLNEARKAVRQKELKIQSLLGEIGVWKRSKEEQNMEIEKLSQDLREFKDKFYALKRKHQTSTWQKSEKLQGANSTPQEQHKPGGDFIMTVVSFDR